MGCTYRCTSECTNECANECVNGCTNEKTTRATPVVASTAMSTMSVLATLMTLMVWLTLAVFSIVSTASDTALGQSAHAQGAPTGITPAGITSAGITSAGITSAGITPAGVTPASVAPAQTSALPTSPATARITMITPPDRVFYPGEEIKLRVVFSLDRAVQFENPAIYYQVSDLESGEVVATGVAPFNRTLATAGWVELRPEIPRDSKLRWYRAALTFVDGEREIPIRVPGLEGARQGMFGGSREVALEVTLEVALEEALEGDGAFAEALEGTHQGARERAFQGSLEGTRRSALQSAVEGTVEVAAEGAAEGAVEGAAEGATEGAHDGASEAAIVDLHHSPSGDGAPRAAVSFGVLPETPDYDEWSVKGVEPVVPSRKVMAFYYPWYGNPLVSRRWVHWPEGGHNPDTVDAAGLPDIGAAHHPALGPYDSHDPRVIQQHLEWAEAAGIDVLIASWWGQGEFSDQALARLLDAAAETSVRISVYYEAVPGSSENGALADFRYLLSKYGEHPGFFKHEGEPVIFVYGRALGQLPYDVWQRVLETIKSEYNVKLIADSLDARWAELFDGLHMYNPVGPLVGGSDMRRIYESLVWAAASQGKVSSVTVIPGYDDSNIGRTSVIVAPRRDGALYDELWGLALESRPDWVIITSFNEWHEGSEIEPSVEHGDHYLRSTAEWAARYKQASERTLWVERSSMPVVVVPGKEYPVSISVVRLGDGGPVDVHWELPEGWAVSGVEAGSVSQAESKPESKSQPHSESRPETQPVSQSQSQPELESRLIQARLIVPDDAAYGEYDLQVTLSWRGFDLKRPETVTVVDAADVPFDGVGVWTELGAENRAFGLVQRDHPDGMTAPVTVDGIEARRTAPGVTDAKYIYFDVADGFIFDASGVEVEIGIEYLDERPGTFRLHYDSTNPMGGPFAGAYTDGPVVTMRGTGEWQTAVIRVPDARFANRQNGATDFRFAVGTNDLTFRRVWVRVLDGSGE